MNEIELNGKHVMLLPLHKKYISDLFFAGNHHELWDFMSMRVSNELDMERLVNQALQAKQKGKQFPFVIIDKKTKRAVGSTRYLDISEADRNLEIGWTWLSPTVWRTPINTECKYLLLRHAFEELDVLRVQLKTDGRNRRSQKAIERLGAVKEGVLRKNRIMYDGYVRDSVYYSILREEWPSIKSKLESYLI